MKGEDCLFCGKPATWVMDHGDDDGWSLKGTVTLLCDSCKEVYEAGQVSPAAEAWSMAEWDERDGWG